VFTLIADWREFTNVVVDSKLGVLYRELLVHKQIVGSVALVLRL
jgi:hypothetical protein